MSKVRMNMHALLGSLTHDELKFIASRDYGVDADIHLDALCKVLQEQGGTLSAGQHWYPYEVIELCAHGLLPGHEREFVACTLLVVHAVVTGYDRHTQLGCKFNDRAEEYDQLPAQLRDLVLDAYVAADPELDGRCTFNRFA